MSRRTRRGYVIENPEDCAGFNGAVKQRLEIFKITNEFVI
jgi:hypothetical protein